ncbi:ferredoxin:CoB-CoM heterodisulfide reductase subunit HdrC [Methanosarcina sp.]|jgi:heterodisulfide reductase subunit C|uniref:ferredoxin:CoB-CoM heterodisulfide reductase subunit HdrC n=1 Tax=Methanosarcina sp. TaxID=2213 RepID=UPI002B81879A|nr:ferredoxin:CoB-CoM heterodisulfide reductase subunit HdrC [Methanosarcina sp.]HOW13232.1 4Fe-4S dicluster domain-containing protein [Methanosarcina sp.]
MIPYVNEYDTPDCKTLAETAKKSIRTPESLGLDRCIQCGACTASCPAARFTDYSPRQIVKKVLENDRSVLESEMIWSCFYCYSCNVRCPRNNSPVTIVQVLRQMAINEGIGVEKLAYFLEIGEYLAENGASKVPVAGIKNMERDLGERWIGIKRNLEVIRSELGLSSRDVRDTHGEVQAILESTGYFDREKWIKEKIQEKKINGFLNTNYYSDNEKKNGDFRFESDRKYTGQEALIV